MLNFKNITNRRRNFYLVLCFLFLGFSCYEVYDTFRTIKYKNDHPEYVKVKTPKRVHWNVTGMRYIKNDSNVVIGIAEVDPTPVITDLKKDEEINQDANWQLVEKYRQNQPKK